MRRSASLFRSASRPAMKSLCFLRAAVALWISAGVAGRARCSARLNGVFWEKLVNDVSSAASCQLIGGQIRRKTSAPYAETPGVLSSGRLFCLPTFHHFNRVCDSARAVNASKTGAGSAISAEQIAVSGWAVVRLGDPSQVNGSKKYQASLMLIADSRPSRPASMSKVTA